ncbi:MAG: hypothetical protein KAQ67_06750, partial [Gammaproteobacteria bacterium]|nr:hypothetical protein [Gammaproteobacteria bacterium]
MIKSLPPVLILPLLALAFLTGIVVLQLQSQLVSLYWSGLLIPVFALTLYFKRHFWTVFLFLGFLLSGFFWANLHGWHYLQSVPDISLAGQDILISGVVSDLPVKQSRSTRFRFDIDNFEL